MPITLYQIQTKFRNEERPRFGVLRTSEFLMKDAYSFDASLEGLNESYDKMYAAYCRIFDRCGLDYLAVEAESGPIGGDASHEFMVLADNGEDTVLHCTAAAMRPIRRRPRSAAATSVPSDVPQASRCTKCATPRVGSIEQVSKLLRCKPQQMIKTLIYLADGKPLAVLIRGDHEANEGKIRRAAGAEGSNWPPEDDRASDRRAGRFCRAGGDEGADSDLWPTATSQQMVNGVTGANEADKHLTGVNLGRDFQVDRFADLRNAVDGDPCPRCSSTLAAAARHRGRATSSSWARNTPRPWTARFLDQNEQLKPIIMGCYGIGVNRIIAALIETSTTRTASSGRCRWPRTKCCSRRSR